MSKSPLPAADIFKACPECGAIDAVSVCRFCSHDFMPGASSSSHSVGFSGRVVANDGVAPFSCQSEHSSDAI